MKSKMTILVILFVGLLLGISCSKKAQAQSGAGRASPASDFSYDLSTDGKGIKITGYTGNGGRVVIPSIIEDMPVVEIKGVMGTPMQGAFQGRAANKSQYFPANNITEIIIPSSVIAIGDGALSFNDNLIKVTLPNGIKVLARGVFKDCGKLTSVNLPTELEEIDMYAFENCGELNNLIISDSIRSIKFIEGNPGAGNNFAFRGCGKLPIKTRQTILDLGYKSELNVF